MSDVATSAFTRGPRAQAQAGSIPRAVSASSAAPSSSTRPSVGATPGEPMAVSATRAPSEWAKRSIRRSGRRAAIQRHSSASRAPACAARL